MSVKPRNQTQLIFISMRRASEGIADRIFLLSSDRTRVKASKLHQGRFRLDIRKSCFTKSKLPRPVISAPYLAV